MIFTHPTNNQKRQSLSPPKWGAVALRSYTKAFSTIASGQLSYVCSHSYSLALYRKGKPNLTTEFNYHPHKGCGDSGVSCAASEQGRWKPDIVFEESQYFSLCFTVKKNNPQSSYSPDCQRETGLGHSHNSS